MCLTLVCTQKRKRHFRSERTDGDHKVQRKWLRVNFPPKGVKKVELNWVSESAKELKQVPVPSSPVGGCSLYILQTMSL